MRKKALSVILAIIFSVGVSATQTVQAQAATIPAIIPSITIAAPWDPSITFTFTNVYELCWASGGRLWGVYTDRYGTVVVSQDVSIQYHGDMLVSTFEGNKVHPMSDFSYAWAHVGELGVGGFEIGVPDAAALFNSTSRTFGNIRDYAVSGTATPGVTESAYTVTYNANGGTGGPTDTTEYESGALAEVRFYPLPYRNGYTFLGWANSAAASSPEYVATAGGADVITINGNVTLYAVWRQNSTGGGSTGGSGGSSGGGGGNFGGGTTSNTPGAPAPVKQANAVNETQKAIDAAKKSGSATAEVKMKNVSDISLNTMKSVSKAAGNTPVKISADSMNGSNVDVRITIDPAKAVKGISLSASTTSQTAINIAATFKKHFKNNVSVVSLSQQGDFGMPVEIAAKLGADLNVEKLVFYSYDKTANSYVQITDVKYSVDKNGYVHFTTTLAGDIIITDKPLAKG